jgi:hypothetical protein
MYGEKGEMTLLEKHDSLRKYQREDPYREQFVKGR